MIPESLLQRIWKAHEEFLREDLRLVDEAPVRIVNAGSFNDGRGGPDFLDAEIELDGVRVRGDIELHTTASEWASHGHSSDPKYNRVILHVVLTLDGPDDLECVPVIPTLILANHLRYERREIWKRLFELLYDRSPTLPCHPHNIQVPMRLKRRILEKFGDARLEELVDRLSLDGGDASEQQLLERVYQLSMDALGYSKNRIPFRELSALLPLQMLRRMRELGLVSRLHFEALFFGTSGLLPRPSTAFDRETNEYLVDLWAAWEAIRSLLRIQVSLAESDWAFFRLRPLNSPSRRIAVAAHLAQKYYSDPKWNFESDYFEMGSDIDSAQGYWDMHTSFVSKQNTNAALLGKERRVALWLNVILPSRIARSRMLEMDAKQGAHLSETWAQTPTESSAKYLRVVQQELLEGESVNSVRSEQGALILIRNFCEKRRCSECPVGQHLIENGWTRPVS